MSIKLQQSQFWAHRTLICAIAAAVFATVLSAPGANGQEQPQPQTQPRANNNGTRTVPAGRPQPGEGMAHLTFSETPVPELIPTIVNLTGKVVIPVNLPQLGTVKITLLHDQPIERAAALDLLLTALRLNGVGIIETRDLVILDRIENMRPRTMTVLTADDDVMERSDIGTFVVKVYRLKEANVDTVVERLSENLPDYAHIAADPNSNQIIFRGDIATAQHFQTLIWELDRSHVVVKEKTWRLAYADATAIEEQIYQLFDIAPSQPGTGRTQVRPTGRPQPGRPPGAAGATAVSATGAGPGPVVELRVSVNVRQNSVTVVADPPRIEKIDNLILTEWDLPLAEGTAKVYVLHHTDPLKVRDLLQSLLGTSGGARPGARAGQPRGATPTGGAGAGASVSEVIGDIYRIEAYPDQNSIVVLSKTTKALDYLDSIIASIDQPSSVGLPVVIPLKHANAVSLADELNVLLAEAGTGQGLERPATGLTGEGIGGMSDTGTGDTGLGTAGRTGGTTGGGGARGTMDFPWQRGRPRDDQSEPSSLIGKVRIVPVIRQNALAILAPVAQRQAVTELIHEFDRPGRQVLISAIIAEVELSGDLALGVRFGSGDLVSSSNDNSLRGSAEFSGSRELGGTIGKLFDTAILDVGANVNVLIQALHQKTNVRILQEPRIFTADNQEAIFFDGQDVPFITNSSVTDFGGLTQSFQYRQVGVFLNVRPRITVERDVDLEVNLEISNIVPGQTLFGGAILDRRQTTTQVIVKNAQTIVLSGILKDNESQITRGIPILQDIPLIGELFKSRENNKSTSELIAFITPIVVDNPSENYDNFNELERLHLQDLGRPLRKQVKQKEIIREKIVAPRNAQGIPERIDLDKGDRQRRDDEDDAIDVDDSD